MARDPHDPSRDTPPGVSPDRPAPGGAPPAEAEGGIIAEPGSLPTRDPAEGPDDASPTGEGEGG